MLKRLRNKILVLNMLLTTVVVAIAFAVIYLIMDSQIQAENWRKLDPYGKIQNIDSLIDLPEASYHLAAETAWKHKDGHGSIAINGRLWQYAVLPATSTQVVNENGMQTISAAQDGSYQISIP